MNFQASIIISFYNKIEWLKLVLAALELQSIHDFEVIIADDGSKDEVVKDIAILIQKSPLHIQHIWHPDAGFMKTTILNKSIIASQSNYLVFIDGDCVPHHKFIEDHVRLQKSDHVLAGRRVQLSESISKSLTVSTIHQAILQGSFIFRLFWDSIAGDSRNVEKGIHIGSKKFNQRFGRYNKGLLGCNFSVSKQNLLAVNGFDERYRYPCVGEDSEIEYRFIKKGLKIFSPKFSLIQYHLWHPLLSRENQPENMELFKETIDKEYVYHPYGIKK